MRRAKIVCTLGLAVSSEEKIRELVESGMDVARLTLQPRHPRHPFVLGTPVHPRGDVDTFVVAK